MLDRFIGTLMLAALTPLSALGQTDELEKQYKENLQKIEETTASLTAEQWNFKSAPDRWSVAEVLEHITVAEAWIFDVVSEQLVAKDVTDSLRAASEEKEQGLLATLSDRSQKFDAPEQFIPTGRWGSPDSLMKQFVTTREKMMVYIRSVDFDLRTKFALHPFVGEIDAHTWLAQAIAHGDRHLDQIREVMAHSAFPETVSP